MNIKDFLALISVLGVLIAYYPYFRDIFNGKTKPHMYTWLVWTITMSVGVLGILRGDGSQGVFSLALGTVLVAGVMLLSIKYGTKDITKSDTLSLAAAMVALGFWFYLDSPYLAVTIAALIDAIGYYPTFRKSYSDPHSETISFWVISIFVSTTSVLANENYNFLTVSYLGTILLMNFSLTMFLLVRRRAIKI